MKLPPEVKTIAPPNFKWEAGGVYRVMVSYRQTNPIHEAILHVGFLNDDGTPGAYSGTWRNSYGHAEAFSGIHYLEVIEKLCVLPYMYRNKRNERNMKFQTHNDAPLSNDDTSWTFSTIQATKANLIKTFGQPQELGGKVQFGWIIKFADGTLATVYDWKQRREIGDTDLINWNIGALSSDASGRAVSAVHAAYREAHGLGAHRKVA